MRWFGRKRRDEAPKGKLVSSSHGQVHRAGAAEAEHLESRVLMTTFSADIAFPQNAIINQTITVDLTTFGGIAQSWDIDWGDNMPHGSVLPNGSQTAQCTHIYTGPGSEVVTAIATPVDGGQPYTAAFALDVGFGDYPAAGDGLTADIPTGGTGSNLGGKAMVVDPVTGQSYVTTNYNGLIAITRFTTTGLVDTTWAGGTSTLGTMVPPTFDGGTDSPLGLYLRGQYLAVAGKGVNGFAVALIDTRFAGTKLWSVPLTGNPAIEGGQSNAVYIDRMTA